MSRRIFLAWLSLALAGQSAWAQISISRGQIPTRSALGRVGLEKHWSAAVPLRFGDERVLGISMAGQGPNERQSAAVYHAPATPARFTSDSNLSADDDFYVGASLVFTGGELNGQARDITGYDGETRTFSFQAGFPAAPAAGDAFEIRGYNERIAGAVAHAPATPVSFITAAPLSPRDGHYVGATLVFTSGPLSGLGRAITGYTARAHRFEFTVPFPEAPGDGDTFVIRGALLAAQTNQANLHVFDAESGQYLWTAGLGAPTATVRPIAVNANYIYVTNGLDLIALDRRTGQQVWVARLEALASSAPAADEDAVAIGLVSGKLVAFAARDLAESGDVGNTPRRMGKFLWAWQTGGKLTGRPDFAGRLLAWGSHDGKVYVAITNPTSLLLRYLTAGPVSASLGNFGTRSLIVPSEDNNVYSIDLFTGDTNWTVPTGAPVAQEPLVASAAGTEGGPGATAYIINRDGLLFALNAVNGETYWSRSSFNGKLLTVGEKRIYLSTPFHDLFIIGRADGAVVSSPRETFDRAGLNLRDYTITITNRINDRLYFVSPSGSMLCLREMGKTIPAPLRDAKLPPFGTIPQGEATVVGDAPEAPAGEREPAEPPPAEEDPPGESPE